MDAFDRFWQWANKPAESPLTIPADLHRAVMELAPEDRLDRSAVNQRAGPANSDSSLSGFSA
ncbi:hypothetical protein M2192_009465 [Bradyrhizobium elkanii USDA 61]|uniref:hypothetical protein n=1 Tax=Bradyrhizobium elkanii TaxID=29448 RepID=UPI00216A8F62|nr:hypothetical protein [Bradyrhizobium elkanii]MCS3585611.1 hypothetical protein [Bradyrhizobium elkanii]MCS3724970.1 hypothetical protein [Bradyrhizobium elkanii]MCS4012445.1 hypothetical protein [Bradyrhizobium elkanii USDA 61]